MHNVTLPIGVLIEGQRVRDAEVGCLTLRASVQAEAEAEIVVAGVDPATWRGICRLAARVRLAGRVMRGADLLELHEADADVLWQAAKEVEATEASFRRLAAGVDGGAAGLSHPTGGAAGDV